MKSQGTSVGLDVHARSVFACALDGDTGEVSQRRLTPDHGEIVAWLGDLPGPVAVAYEAGPTGFGLARALTAAGIACEVAAPSKLIRPAGDRVKTAMPRIWPVCCIWDRSPPLPFPPPARKPPVTWCGPATTAAEI